MTHDERTIVDIATLATNTAERLRALADWLDDHPTAEMRNFYADSLTGKLRILDCKMTKSALEYVAQTIGGQWTLKPENEWYRLTQEVIPGVEYVLYADHRVVPMGIHCWSCGAVPNVRCCEFGRIG